MIFIDLGAYDGRSSRAMHKKHGDELTGCYMFEPNPFLKVTPPRCPSELIPAAAWTHWGDMDLYLSNPEGLHNGQGSTSYHDKTTGWLDEEPTRVDCVDFAQWLTQNILTKCSDKVHVKMNVEGAEYALIEHLDEVSLLASIHTLYVSWHVSKIPSITTTRHERAIEALRRAGLDNQTNSGTFPTFEEWTQ